MSGLNCVWVRHLKSLFYSFTMSGCWKTKSAMKSWYPAQKSAKQQHFQNACANFSLFTHTTCLRNALISQEHRSHPSILGHLVPVITSSESSVVFRAWYAKKSRQLHRIFWVYITRVNAVEKRGLFFTQPLPSTLKHRHRRLSTDPHHHNKTELSWEREGRITEESLPKTATVPKATRLKYTTVFLRRFKKL